MKIISSVHTKTHSGFINMQIGKYFMTGWKIFKIIILNSQHTKQSRHTNTCGIRAIFMIFNPYWTPSKKNKSNFDKPFHIAFKLTHKFNIQAKKWTAKFNLI